MELNTLLHTLLSTSCDLQAFALSFVRIFMGVLFIKHGSLKIIRGKAEILWTGEQMKKNTHKDSNK